MERLIIDGDGAEVLDGELVGQLWDLVHDYPITITIDVDLDEEVVNQGGPAFSSEEPAALKVYGVDFGGEEPFNGNR